MGMNPQIIWHPMTSRMPLRRGVDDVAARAVVLKVLSFFKRG